MDEPDDPWPLWSERASKADVIRAVVHLRSVIGSLAGAIVSMRANDEATFIARMDSYFEAEERLQNAINEIGGANGDG